ncbi:hypothetical protein GCM10023195_79910 [Actinoallomurus liliacearum]|uniref:Uncharacterized protein n=1 Tax=Actinoallomurus liliacearum TaxID=1080073 RepID=A0ABP8TYC1_9ACTN
MRPSAVPWTTLECAGKAVRAEAALDVTLTPANRRQMRKARGFVHSSQGSSDCSELRPHVLQ